MKKLISLILVLVAMASVGMAQRTATLTIKNFVNVANTTYHFDIFARSTGVTAISVGTTSFFFDYNSSGLSTPTLTNVNSKYTTGSPSGDYNAMTAAILAGQIGVTVTYDGLGTDTGGTLSTASPDGELICTVNMVITNSSLLAGLSWNSLNTAMSHKNSAAVTVTLVGSDNSSLPIQLANFNAASLSNSSVKLSWSTLSETENYGFEVQRSSVAASGFVGISGLIAGHGTTTERHDYSYIDENAGMVNYYYRLKQIDLNSTVNFTEPIRTSGTSGVAEQQTPTEFALQQNYPNPFNPSTVIEFSLPTASRVVLELYNLLGQKIQTLVDGVRPTGFYQVPVNGASLSSGVYLYRLTAGDKVFVRKMTLVK